MNSVIQQYREALENKDTLKANMGDKEVAARNNVLSSIPGAAVNAATTLANNSIDTFGDINTKYRNNLNLAYSSLSNNAFTGLSVTDAYNSINANPFTMKKKDFFRSGASIGKTVLSTTGAGAGLGATIGAAALSWIPGVGTLVGGLLGAGVGAAAGAVAGGGIEGIGAAVSSKKYKKANKLFHLALEYSNRNDINLANNANFNTLFKPKNYTQDVNSAAEGGSLHNFLVGLTYDLDEKTIQTLKKKGYVIQHLE